MEEERSIFYNNLKKKKKTFSPFLPYIIHSTNLEKAKWMLGLISERYINTIG